MAFETTIANPNFPNNPGYNLYKGARYVPIFSKQPGSVWTNSIAYEPLTIVLWEGNSYTSKTFVPVGVDISNTDFWAQTGNYNAQLQQLIEKVNGFEINLNNIKANKVYVPYSENISDYSDIFLNLANSWIVLDESAVYPVNKPLDYNSGKTIFEGNNATLDFSLSSGEHGLVTRANSVYIKDLRVSNVKNGYGFYFYYAANYSYIENIFALNCNNGVYITGMWYTTVQHVRIYGAINDGLTIGDLKAENGINGQEIKDIYISGPKYGIHFINESNLPASSTFSINGCTIEHTTECGIMFENNHIGYFYLYNVYFESNTGTEFILIDASAQTFPISVMGMWIRNHYSNNPTLCSDNVLFLTPVQEAFTGAYLGGKKIITSNEFPILQDRKSSEYSKIANYIGTANNAQNFTISSNAPQASYVRFVGIINSSDNWKRACIVIESFWKQASVPIVVVKNSYILGPYNSDTNLTVTTNNANIIITSNSSDLLNAPVDVYIDALYSNGKPIFTIIN